MKLYQKTILLSFIFICFIFLVRASAEHLSDNHGPTDYAPVEVTSLYGTEEIGNMHSNKVYSGQQTWKKLFNGENLDGWEVKCVEKDKGKNYWKADNGTILCDTRGNTDHHYIWLQTEDEFADFELRLQFQAGKQHEGNSGVQVRSRYDETANVMRDFTGWMDGPQVDIEINNPWRNGLIYDETRGTRHWICPDLPSSRISKEEYAPDTVIYYREDEGPGWNDMRIICNGNHIITFVNNIKVADYDGTGVLDDEDHIENNVGTKGHIALQLHMHSNNYIRFKDIEIQEIK